MKENTITHIKYTKQTKNKDEVTERFIIPSFIPKQNIKAMDVTDCDDSSRQNLEDLLKDYSKFYSLHMSNIPSFTNWMEQTNGVIVSEDDIKWRTFKIANTEIIE